MQDTALMLHTLLELGESMLADGADVRRVEQTLTRMGLAYGAVRMDVFVITSSIVLTMCFPDETSVTQTRRIEKSAVTDFRKLEAINAISRSYCEKPFPVQELADRLAGLRAETASLEAERETILRTTQQIHDLFEEMAGDRKARLDQIAQAETGTQQLQQTLQMHERRLAELRQRAETLRSELAACSSRKLELEGQRTRTDRDAQARNRDLLDMQGLVSRFEQKKLSADMEEKQILDKLWDNYELSRTAAEALRQPIENMTKASRRIAELRRGIGALGTPNLGAIDEFTRVNTRYTFLTGQRDDILKAKRELTGIIADVTGEMEGIFTTQFQAIDQAFRQTFLELFGGGKAALVLEDPEHVLDSGIEIKVQPPGKALSTLSLMSGGEMAFVAIALYFAILKVRPTPFCVMDEIEAALDEANVTRYVQYMRRLAKSTQFLVITHRRGTMEEADHLFGVTMQEKGVSRIIELSLDEAAKTIS